MSSTADTFAQANEELRAQLATSEQKDVVMTLVKQCVDVMNAPGHLRDVEEEDQDRQRHDERCSRGGAGVPVRGRRTRT